MKKKLLNTAQWLTNIVELQLFLSLLSWPILVHWGIPQSYMGLIGNIIFQPFLLVFLFFSSILFLLSIFSYNSPFVIYCLDTTSSLWLSSMYRHDSFFHYSPSIPAPILITVPLLTMATVYYMPTTKTRLLIFLGLIACCLGVSFLAKTDYLVSSISCNKKPITSIKAKNQRFIVIPNGKIPDACSYARYTLIPELIKKNGDPLIKTIILKKLTRSALSLCKEIALCQKIEHIYFCSPYSAQELIECLNDWCSKSSISVHICNKEPISFCLETGGHLIIRKNIQKKELEFFTQ